MRTWVVPFIFIAFWMAVFLFAPDSRRATVQARIKKLLNNLLVVEIILIILSIMDTVFFRQHWIGWLSWLTLALSIAVIGYQVFAPEPPPSDHESPL